VRVGREFKRRVGDPTPLLVGGSPVAAELLMARVVHWVVDRVAATEGEPPASLAVSHPANRGEFKLDLLRQALRHGGVPADHLVPEPVAAATAYATQRELAPGTVVAVYDLGGGTFDAALVRAGAEGFEIVGRPDGIERLGGIDFDHAVFRNLLDAIGLGPDTLDEVDPGTATGLAQLREECVDAKEALSSETGVSIPVMLPERHTEIRLTRSELEAMIRPARDETLVALRRAIASADVAVPDVDRVLLVGGSSRIPLVGQMVTAALDRPIAVDARPKDAIALGAALTGVAAAPRTAPLPPTPVVVPATGGVGTLPPQSAPSAAGAPHRAPASPTPPRHAPPLYSPPPPGPDAVRDRRVLMAVLVAIILVAGAVGAFALLSNGDDPQSSVGSTPTTTTERAPRTTTTTTPEEPSGEPTPLPGSDWNAEARAQFVADCGRLVGEEVGGLIGASQIGPACGCAYDELEQAGEVTFADFNAMWVADDIEPSDPTLRAFSNAFISCATGTN
jgi:actin-like ATPase involved in cell morphogenesis